MTASRTAARKGLVIVLGLLLATAGVAPASAGEPIVSLDSGPIRGTVTDQGTRESSTVYAFKGIPYAAPPLGPLRWRPPEPVEPWEEVLDCLTFGPACPQPSNPIRIGRSPETQDEDCLSLNVWSADLNPPEPRPVMVWIHGGGHTIGASSLPTYDGAEFARRGVVLVSINYRLGPLGYLAHPSLSAESDQNISGNYGLLDQIAALQWVQRNIAQFGGDPKNVTIFGESAGAVSAATLMATPSATGLFHRAILQSGTAHTPKAALRDPVGTRPSAEETGRRLARTLGCEDSRDVAEALRAKTPEQLLKAEDIAVGLMAQGIRFGPVVDGVILPDQPRAHFDRGEIAAVPTILGTNADEGLAFLGNAPIRGRVGYVALVRAFARERAPAVLRAFPPPDSPDEVKPALNRLLTVGAFVAPARAAARNLSRIQPNTYLYHFTRVSPLAERSGLGAAHGLEIPYVFGNLPPGPLYAAADRSLADAMINFWVRFAATGNPNPPDSPDLWPPSTAEADPHLEFGDTIRAGSGLLRREVDALGDGFGTD